MAGKAGFEPTIIVFQDYCFTDVTVRLTIVTEEYFKQCLFLNFFPIMLTCTPTLIRTENNSFGDCHDNRFTIDVYIQRTFYFNVPPTGVEPVFSLVKSQEQSHILLRGYFSQYPQQESNLQPHP